eukprot:scaffold168394_cov31-Tisochrysis_lutea.AAC.4
MSHFCSVDAHRLRDERSSELIKVDAWEGGIVHRRGRRRLHRPRLNIIMCIIIFILNAIASTFPF